MYERPSAGVTELPPYVVVCLDSDPTLEADGHRHVTAVQTRDPDGVETRWRVVEVIAAIRDGERFVVGEDGRGVQTLLEPAICPRCPTITLMTDPEDATAANCD